MMLLPYEIRDDDHYPQGGVAAIVVPAAAGRASGPVDVVIVQEDPESPYLGPRGWQPGEYRWQSSPVRDEGTDLIVPLGERVTAQIEDYTPVRVELPDLKMQGMVMWAGITPPSSSIPPASDPGARGGSSFLTPPVVEKIAPPPPTTTPPPPTTTPPPIPVTTPPPMPEPEPEVTSAPPQLPPALPVPPTTTAPPPVTHPPVDDHQDPLPPPTGSGKTWIIVLAILAAILLVIGAVIAIYVPNTEEAASVAQVPPAEAPAPAPAPAPASAAPQPPTLPELHARGLAAVSAGDFNEAWRQFRSPDAQSYGPTLLYLAQALDTIDFTPGLYQEPNNIAALQLYVRACTTGEAGAVPAFGKMVEEITRLADTGDVLAMETLRLEVPKAKDVCR